jgi:hypothetical protein
MAQIDGYVAAVPSSSGATADVTIVEVVIGVETLVSDRLMVKDRLARMKMSHKHVVDADVPVKPSFSFESQVLPGGNKEKGT